MKNGLKKTNVAFALFMTSVFPPLANAGYYELLSGKGMEVCEDYQRNLNSFSPNIPMEFVRKLNPNFKEFSKPSWTPIVSPSGLLIKVENFLWKRDANPAYYFHQTHWRGTRKEYAKAKTAFDDARGERWLTAQMVAKVDVDNDGTAENVLSYCFGEDGCLLLVLNDDLTDINYDKTKLVLRHPSRSKIGILRPYAYGEWKLPQSIGSRERTLVEDSLHSARYGVFTYKNKNYFDLWWEDPPEANGSPMYRKERLRVFLAERNSVEEVCNYRFVW